MVTRTRCTDKVQQRRDDADTAAVQGHNVVQAVNPGSERQRYASMPTSLFEHIRNQAVARSRLHTHHEYLVFIVEQNLAGNDALVLAVMLPECGWSHERRH